VNNGTDNGTTEGVLTMKCDDCNDVELVEEYEIENDLCKKWLWEQFGAEIMQQAYEQGLIPRR